MKASGSHLLMPVYLKLSPDMPWPEDERAFYVLARNGLFIGRNHEFFRSCARAAKCPSELAPQAEFVRLSYPKLPRRSYELAVGFFTAVADVHSAEAIVLLVWNRNTSRTSLHVPKQRSIVSRGWNGGHFPISVEYDTPTLAPHLAIIGDIHSHVDGPAYTSVTDADDAAHRPGLHLVVGRIHRDPPELHVEASIDGRRFPVDDHREVLEGYEQRRTEEVPRHWIDKVRVKVLANAWTTSQSAQNPPCWNYRHPATQEDT
jgi:hypothetical protein